MNNKPVLNFTEFVNENIEGEDLSGPIEEPRKLAYTQHEYDDVSKRAEDAERRANKVGGVIIWDPNTKEIEVIFTGGDPTYDVHGFEDEKSENPHREIYFVNFTSDSSTIRTSGGELDMQDVEIINQM